MATKKCLNCKNETLNKKFCSRSCYLEYKRTHFKKKRSKLEKFLSTKLKKQYPGIRILENDRQALGVNLELDIYFPEFKIGIEINGKMHYEFVPYFHKNKKRFQEQLKRDAIKRNKCKELGIYLITVLNFKAFNLTEAQLIYEDLRMKLDKLINKPSYEDLIDQILEENLS